MRSRHFSLALALHFLFSFAACTSKPQPTPPPNPAPTPTPAPQPAPKPPIDVPAGTTITVRLASALGSKISKSGDGFQASVTKDVLVDNNVAIPAGSAAAGTVTDAKPLGKIAGAAVLTLRLDVINLNGADQPVKAAHRTFTVQGKGKRTGIMAGGGAVIGGIVGAFKGKGKGAAAGATAGGAAGAGGSALTANKDIVLPTESALTFTLSQPLEIQPQ